MSMTFTESGQRLLHYTELLFIYVRYRLPVTWEEVLLFAKVVNILYEGIRNSKSSTCRECA